MMAYSHTMVRQHLVAIIALFVACQKDPPPAPPPSVTAESAPVPSAPQPPPPPPSVDSAPPPVASEPPPTTYEPVITTREKMLLHVGQIVTLDGVVERSKIPTLLGADINDIDPAGHEVRGKHCRATGLLQKEVVTKEEMDEAFKRHGGFATRGAGTFYSLVKADGGGIVTPIPIGP
jgi:hypothetical protein